MECSIQRPSSNQKDFYSGKQKEHTLKIQVLIDRQTKKIICLEHGRGRIHDFKIFKNSNIKLGKTIRMIADKGYQGNAAKLSLQALN